MAAVVSVLSPLPLDFSMLISASEEDIYSPQTWNCMPVLMPEKCLVYLLTSHLITYSILAVINSCYSVYSVCACMKAALQLNAYHWESSWNRIADVPSNEVALVTSFVLHLLREQNINSLVNKTCCRLGFGQGFHSSMGHIDLMQLGKLASEQTNDSWARMSREHEGGTFMLLLSEQQCLLQKQLEFREINLKNPEKSRRIEQGRL